MLKRGLPSVKFFVYVMVILVFGAISATAQLGQLEVPKGGITLTPSKTKVALGKEFSVSWNNPGTTYATDWIGFRTSNNEGGGTYTNTDGAATGTRIIKAPAKPNIFYLAYFQHDNEVARSNIPINVTFVPFTITPSKTTVVVGEEFSVSWNNPGTTYANDWLGFQTKEGQGGGTWVATGGA